MSDFYGTAAAVIARTGVGPADLGLADDAALTAFVEGVLAEVTDLMDRVMRQSYLGLADPVPAGLGGIAADAAADSIRTMVATRQTPVVRIDDFAVRAIQAKVLSADVTERLKLYAKGRGLVTVEVAQDWLADLPDTFAPADLATEA